MAEHVPGVWEAEVAAYDAGQVGSRRLIELEMSLVDVPAERLLATAAAQPHDPGFVPFVRRAQAAGIPVEIVSDGFGFFIEPALEALGVGELPVVTARTMFQERRASVTFPNGNPACLVCGTCKRDRVLAHQAAGRAVVFIGDGESDRYAAGYSDVVWAKRSLRAHLCRGGLAVPALDGVPRDRGVAGGDPGGLARRSREAGRPRPAPVLLRSRGVGRGPSRSAARVVAAWHQLTPRDQSQPSQCANDSNGTQPRLRLGERTSGTGRPTGMTPIGTNSSGMPR